MISWGFMIPAVQNNTLNDSDNISTIKDVKNKYKKVKPTMNKIRTLKNLSRSFFFPAMKLKTKYVLPRINA